MATRDGDDARYGILRWAIIAFMGLGIVVVATLPPLLSGSYTWRDPAILAYIVGLPAYFVVLLWALPRRYVWGAHGFVGTTCVIGWIFTFALQGTGYLVGNYAYLSVVVMFAAFFLGTRATVAYALANIGVVAVIHTFWRLALVDLILSLSYLIIFSTMLMVIAGLMQKQRDQLHRDAKRLQDAQQTLQSSNQELLSISESIGDGLVLLDPDGTLRRINGRALEMAQKHWRVEPAQGDNVFRLLPERYRPSVAAALASARTRELGQRQVSIDDVHLSVRVTRLDDGAVLATATDITAQVAQQVVEAERQERKAKLDKLALANRLQRNFMDIATHELQMPLTPVRLQLHVLRDRKTGPLTPAQLRSLDILERNTMRLSGLVDEILDVVRIESRSLTVEVGDVEMVEMTHAQMEAARRAASAKNVHLSYTGPASAWVCADSRRLARVMQGLIENAVKFAPMDGNVDIEIRADQMMCWTIHDDGIGFESSQADDLFRPFTQLHDAAEIYGGSGLGLAISRGYIEAQGGRIEGHSAGLGQGSTFRFWLPVATQTVEH